MECFPVCFPWEIAWGVTVGRQKLSSWWCFLSCCCLAWVRGASFVWKSLCLAGPPWGSRRSRPPPAECKSLKRRRQSWCCCLSGWVGASLGSGWWEWCPSHRHRKTHSPSDNGTLGGRTPTQMGWRWPEWPTRRESSLLKVLQQVSWTQNRCRNMHSTLLVLSLIHCWWMSL